MTSGLVCGHHHLYSALARGMPAPPRTPQNFQEILELVWWRLDCALDLDMIRWSAMLGALEALEAGTTAIVHHHASPNAIEGSLSVIADACAEVGVRAYCCYEVTDRNGPDGMRAGLAENERFLRSGGRGYVGAHACFTLSESTLEAVAGLAADLGQGVHIHVAEDASIGRWGATRGLDDRRLASRPLRAPRPSASWDGGSQPALEHEQRRRLRPPRALLNTVVLGTDGIGGDMLEEFRIAYVRHWEDDVTATPVDAWSWLESGRVLVPEAAEDRVRWSYEPIDAWHLAFTPGVQPVEVVVAGDVVFRDGHPTRVDAGENTSTSKRAGAAAVGPALGCVVADAYVAARRCSTWRLTRVAKPA